MGSSGGGSSAAAKTASVSKKIAVNGEENGDCLIIIMEKRKLSLCFSLCCWKKILN